MAVMLISFPNPYGYVPKVTFSASGSASTNASADCDIDLVTPACLQSLYNIPSAPANGSQNHLAVTGYIEQWPQEADLRV